MTLVTQPSEIWTIPLIDQDIQSAVEYGITSWPWTYDRMGDQEKGKYDKAISHIVVGRAAQNAFNRIVEGKGYQLEIDKTDYKKVDRWDFRTKGGRKKVDVKTFNYYKDFSASRPALSTKIVVESKLGDTWKRFFPMLIPVDQYTNIPKDYYAFGIVASLSFLHCPDAESNAKFLIAQPRTADPKKIKLLDEVYKGDFVRERTEQKQTFNITIKRVDKLPIKTLVVSMGIGGASGEAKQRELKFERDTEYKFSKITAFHYLRLHGNCIGYQSDDSVFEVKFRNIGDKNIDAVVRGTDFYDVWIHHGVAYFIGWISREDFTQARKKYPAYEPDKSKQQNAEILNKTGFLEEGSFWYVLPPLRRGGGGTKRPNYYCLPEDLRTMDSLLQML